jgi:hypothetical protein
MYFSDGYAMKPVPESFRNWDLAYSKSCLRSKKCQLKKKLGERGKGP